MASVEEKKTHIPSDIAMPKQKLVVDGLGFSLLENELTDQLIRGFVSSV